MVSGDLTLLPEEFRHVFLHEGLGGDIALLVLCRIADIDVGREVLASVAEVHAPVAVAVVEKADVGDMGRGG